MSKWGKTQGDSGILRKNEGPEKIEDLLVFGYACKLFRDDEKALEIDQGKHLIPWMGDESLKIDRYDGRAALSDLSEYEGSTEGYDTARWLGLTDAERRVEQLCDEERYRSLHTNEDEEELYREEELKRLHQQLSSAKNYGQVSYDYDLNKTQETQNSETSKDEPEDGEPFVPPPDFDLPVNMIIPKTLKQHARIEKTAMFISQQGTQMEILLKAKQAGNPQFDFLSHDSSLHRYYRHILMAIKSGRYKYASTMQQESAPDNEDGEHYLHPSLASITSRVESAPSIPNIAYKPSADCAYTMLISKIKGKKSAAEATGSPGSTSTSDNQATTSNISSDYNFPSNSTYIYNYATGKYEPAPSYTVPSDTNSQMVHNAANPFLSLQSTMTAQYTNYINNYNQNLQNVPVTATSEIAQSAIIYNKENENQLPPIMKMEKPKHPILPIAEYSGSSDSENESDNENITKAIINVPTYEVPPADVQLIIDKMASYVARNGSDFEAIVRSKGDPRFSFLFPDHIYHAYYKHKLKLYGGIVDESTAMATVTTTTVIRQLKSQICTSEEQLCQEKIKTENEDTIKSKNNEKVKKPIAPVSFSIKKAKEPESVPIERSALPVEESSDENETGEDPAFTENSEEKISDINILQIEENQLNMVPLNEIKIPTVEKQHNEETENNQSIVEPAVDTQITEMEDPVQELIDLTNDLENEKRDAKRAEEKIKDKIAAAAREKLSFLSKNRELQIERKKRAAAFLSKIKPIDANVLNGSTASDSSNQTNEISSVKTAEEDDLLKRIGGLDSELLNESTTEKQPSNDNLSTCHKNDRHNIKSDDRYRHKSSRKKRKKRSSSSESRKHHKRSKHTHHRPSESRSESSRHSKKKYQHRSRSRSRSRHSRSKSILHSHRSSSCRGSGSKMSVETSVIDKRKYKSKQRSEDKSSGEISSPSTSNYCSD